jgi:SET domain-containing protein
MLQYGMIFLPTASWEIRDTANKGRGIFAKKPIRQGTIIGDYIGTVVHPRDAVIDEDNFYLMYYHDYAAISPDLTKPGVHLLNHACLPNCSLYVYKGHTLAFALKDMAKGDELTIRYLLAPKDTFCNPCVHVCRCGTLRCVGTMHLEKDLYEKWRMITEAQAKETKKERIRYGKELPLLKAYPESIPKEYIQKVNALFTR